MTRESYSKVQLNKPAAKDLNLRPVRTRQSGHSVHKQVGGGGWEGRVSRENNLYHLVRSIKEDQSNRLMKTCFCAAKITFMKFMYCRAQSSAALITCRVKKLTSYSRFLKHSAHIHRNEILPISSISCLVQL